MCGFVQIQAMGDILEAGTGKRTRPESSDVRCQTSVYSVIYIIIVFRLRQEMSRTGEKRFVKAEGGKGWIYQTTNQEQRHTSIGQWSRMLSRAPKSLPRELSWCNGIHISNVSVCKRASWLAVVHLMPRSFQWSMLGADDFDPWNYIPSVLLVVGCSRRGE